MASRKRGLGTASTEASRKNAPLKIDNSRAENRARASTRRSYIVYDGQQLLGRFIFNETTNKAWAWNASREFIGRFDGYKGASRAISQAAVTEWQRVEARQRLHDPHPPFATGLPEHFLRSGR